MRMIVARSADHQSSKLLAAVTRHQSAAGLGELAQHGCDFDQRLVAEIMAEAVVDRFEVVDVTHEDDRRHACLVRRVQCPRRLIVKTATVEQPGELIGLRDARQFAARQRQLLHQACGAIAQHAGDDSGNDCRRAHAEQHDVADADQRIRIEAEAHRERGGGHHEADASRYGDAPDRLACYVGIGGNL
jgi:hypothetical protein